MKKPPRLSVIIPVYNEQETIEPIVELVCWVDVPKEVILVDDGSKDDTLKIIKNKILKRHSHIRLIEHPVNRGKGAAIRTGIEAAEGELVIIQDADLEYNPQDYQSMVKVFEDSAVQVVYGSRFLSGKKVTHPLHYFVNQVITVWGNLLYGARLTDLETCYKMFRAPFLKSLGLRSDGFEIEAEITCKALKRHCRIVEVPVSYQGRSYSQGKKITWVDGFKALWTLWRMRWDKDR